MIKKETSFFLNKARRNKTEVSGTVKKYDENRKVWIVRISGIDAVQTFDKNISKFRKAPEECVGKTMPFIICNVSDDDVAVSHLDVFLQRKAKEIIRQLKKGQALVGVVSGFNKLGVFIKTQGLEGFAYSSSVNGLTLEKGDHVNVVVEKIDIERIRLELKVTGIVPYKIDNNIPRKQTFEKNAHAIDDVKNEDIIEGKLFYLNPRLILLEYKGIMCVMRNKEFTRSIYDDKQFQKKSGDIIKALVIGKEYYKEKSKKRAQRLVVSSKRIELQEQKEERQKLKEIASQFVVGQEYPITVNRFDKRIAYVNAGVDIPAQILYEDLAGGRIPMEDKVFEGKEMDAVFLRYDNGILYFSTKLLAEKSYKDELYEADTDQLLHTVGITANSFTAKVTEYRDTKYFNYLFADSTENREKDTDGLLLCDNYTGKQLFVKIPDEFADRFETGCYYSIKIKVKDSESRRRFETPFMFELDTDSIADVPQKLIDPYRKLVTETFKKQTSPSQGASLAKLLVEVGDNMYDSKERMFFELLQNADDSSAGKGVEVNLESTEGHLILTHDGMPFNRPDFVSITAAARSSKPKTSKKTGYKGIGFKSVFKAYKVYLKTGGFFFKFDSENELYKDFDRFYFFVNEITDETKQADFIERNREEKKTFNGIESIPWQLLPEWVEEIPDSLKHTVFANYENVSIALAMTDAVKQEYVSAIDQVLSEPKFMLFLRNTNRINYKNGEVEFCIAKDKHGENVALQSTKDDARAKYEFIVRESEPLEVSDVNFANCGVDIVISKEQNSKTNKEESIFRNKAGEKVDSIPPRISDSTDTLISYAIPLDENDQYVALSSSTTLFAYLPMTETRYPFPIYINADFIMKSSREGVQSENPWNYFLFYNIGKEYVKWIAKAASTNQPKYLNLLPTKYLDEVTVGMTNLSAFFNRGYRQSLHEEAFILNDKEELVCMNQIMIDHTGLSDIIDADEYCYLSGIKDCRLPYHKLDIAPLKKNGIFDEIKHIKSLDEQLLQPNNRKYIRNWMTEATEEERTKAFNWLIEQKDESLVKSLPLFEFGDKYYSINEVSGTDNRLFLCGELKKLEDIAEKLHLLCCEDDISKHCLYEGFLKGHFITECNEKAVKILIKRSEEEYALLDNADKALLFDVISTKCKELKWNQKISDWQLFVNMNGMTRAIKSLFAPIADSSANMLLSDYVISSDELYVTQKQIEDYLLPTDKVYGEYILTQWDTILAKWESFHKDSEDKDGKLMYLYNIVQFFYDAAYSAYKLEQSKGNIKAVPPTCFSSESVRYILSGGAFKTPGEVFYHKAMAQKDAYDLIDKIFVCNLPYFDCLHTFEVDPFKTQNSHFKNLSIKPNVLLSIEEITTLLNFCKKEKENIFSYFKIVEQEEIYKVECLDKDEWVFASTSENFRNIVLKNCNKAVVLPPSFALYNTMEGLASSEFVYEKLFATTNGDSEKLLELLEYVQGESRAIKLLYIKYFDNLTISSDLFTAESKYTTLFKLFVELSDEDGLIDKLRNNIKIKGKEDDAIALCEISMQGTVAIGSSVFDMDALLPDDDHTIQEVAASTISSMRLCGIEDKFLNVLFNLNEAISAADVYELLDKDNALSNKEQFAFMLKYAIANKVTKASFKLKDKNENLRNVTDSTWVICDFCFINDDCILCSIYEGFYNYLDDTEKKTLPFGVKIYDSSKMLNFVKAKLESEEKTLLLDYLYGKWDKEHHLMSESELSKVKASLGIDTAELVLAPSKYLLESEKLPKDLLCWIEADNDNRSDFFVKELNVPDSSSQIIAIRKYLLNESSISDVSDIPALVQQQTCSWIKHNNICLSTTHFSFLQSILSKDYYSVSVDVTKLNAYCEKENVLFRFGEYTIYDCHDSIPYNVVLLKHDNYICHSYNEGNVWILGNNIFVNDLCISMDDAILELTNKNMLDAKTYLQYINTPKDQMHTGSLEGGMDTDIDEDRRIARSKQAKKEVEIWLREHGYKVRGEIGEYSNFEVEDKDGKIYPVVVKGFTNKLFINPNEWIALVRPNSRLILYRGHARISVIARKQLLKFKEFLFLRILSSNFDEENIALDEHLDKISQCLQYFERTHIVIDEINPMQFRNSSSLDDIGLYKNSDDIVNQSNSLSDIL